MSVKKPTQNGFHVVEVVIVLLVVAVVGLAGFKVFGHDSNAKNVTNGASNSKSSSGPVKWAYNEKENKWYVQAGVAPACKDPFTFDYSPVDLSLLNVVGMPGVYHNYSYKPHGGFRADDHPDGQVEVRLPIDATLVGLKRYIEGDPKSVQYLLTFETDCGIAFRFDHLYTLTPAFQKIADTTPEPSESTQADPNIPFTRTEFKAGELVATAVGFPANKNIGFDFGVYDYRQRNEISKNPKWAAVHNQYQSSEWYGVCFTDMLPNAAKAKELSLYVLNPAYPTIVSDYCSYAPHTTLEFNDGKPTER